jgi:hypothetical protein
VLIWQLHALFAVFENVTNIRELNLSNNGFNGSLPKTFLALPHLKILDLSYNSFEGGIPVSSPSDDEPASLEVLNLNNNNMSGAFPTEQGTQVIISFKLEFKCFQIKTSEMFT